MNGILVVDKPTKMTSRDVVNELCKLFNMKRIGHTGTLDPLASGVLIVCLGKYTKLVPLLTSLDKEYLASITLNISSDTLDITGNLSYHDKRKINKEDILKVFNNFPKKYLQEVPKYSAVKINGKKLYEYARENIEVTLPKREVNIYDLELLDYQNDIITFKTKVSKGTYIRSLIQDIILKLNTSGVMSSLRRMKQGKFSIENSYTLEDIKNNKYKLLSILDVLDIPLIALDEETYKKVFNGNKIENIYDIKDLVLFTYHNQEIAIYKREDNNLKSYIML